MSENLSRSLTSRISEKAKENGEYVLKDRIDRELGPVVEQNQDILMAVADALYDEKDEKMAESLKLLEDVFQQRNCQIIEDKSLPPDNWGSLDFENGQWVLRVRPEMKQALPFALTEYIHELGALGLIQKSLELRHLDQPVNLNFEKSRLMVKGRSGEVALTHLFDEVLKKLVESHRLNETDVAKLLPSEGERLSQVIQPGEDPLVVNQAEAHTKSSQDWQEFLTPELARQKIINTFSRELGELDIDISQVPDEELRAWKDQLLEHRRKNSR